VPIRRTLTAAAVAALTVAGVSAAAGTAAAAPSANSALGSYIVTLDGTGVPAQVAALASSRLGGRVGHVYTSALDGFAVTLPAALADRLEMLPGVVSVERDLPVETASTTQSPTPSWGLDRIDQRTAVTSTGAFTYNATGAGVTAYIIDTGIQTANTDFSGRASTGFDAFGGTGLDCNGHGTHVAGTVGGEAYGVAKDVSLVGVRVLDCSGNGSTSGVIAGVDWVTANHQAGQPAVANMSLGGGASTALDNAVARSIADGVTYAVAAGNGNTAGIPQDACKSSPARVPAALTVGATDSRDAAASWSNYGSCLDLFAPGVSITSDWYTSATATNTISGTSMATPHVTGVAALYLQANPTASTTTVSTAIKAATTKGVVRTSSRYKSANNNLLFTSY
jgi:subtilisin family serine protease